jgi:hypothetical protein
MSQIFVTFVTFRGLLGQSIPLNRVSGKYLVHNSQSTIHHSQFQSGDEQNLFELPLSYPNYKPDAHGSVTRVITEAKPSGHGPDGSKTYSKNYEKQH